MADIVLTGDTSGAITVAAPAVAGTNTLTLPASTSTIATTADVNALTTGKILQVVQTVKTDTASITSSSTNTFVDLTGLTVAITPSSASSKVLVTVSASVTQSTGMLHMMLVRDSTNIVVGGSDGSRLSSTMSSRFDSSPYTFNNNITAAYSFLDSPNTTSATTYKLQGTLGSVYSGTIYINRHKHNNSNGGSSIMVDTHKAILALYPNVVSVDDTAGAMDKDGNPVAVNMSDVNAWVDPEAYKYQRVAEYPSWHEQLDNIYHNGVDAWKADIKAIKDKYPKGDK